MTEILFVNAKEATREESAREIRYGMKQHKQQQQQISCISSSSSNRDVTKTVNSKVTKEARDAKKKCEA